MIMGTLKLLAVVCAVVELFLCGRQGIGVMIGVFVLGVVLTLIGQLGVGLWVGGWVVLSCLNHWVLGMLSAWIFVTEGEAPIRAGGGK
jgi:hypothetical protein